MKRILNIHPGEVLIEEFLIPLGISQNALARAASVSPRRIIEIVRGITADTAVRLAAALGTSERFWLAGRRARKPEGATANTWNSGIGPGDW